MLIPPSTRFTFLICNMMEKYLSSSDRQYLGGYCRALPLQGWRSCSSGDFLHSTGTPRQKQTEGTKKVIWKPFKLLGIALLKKKNISCRTQIKVDAIFVHEKYTVTGSRANDIALLRLGDNFVSILSWMYEEDTRVSYISKSKAAKANSYPKMPKAFCLSFFLTKDIDIRWKSESFLIFPGLPAWWGWRFWKKIRSHLRWDFLAR